MKNIDAIETIEVVDSPVINFSKQYIDYLFELKLKMNEEILSHPYEDDDDFEWPF